MGRIIMAVLAGAVVWAALWIGGTMAAAAAFPDLLSAGQPVTHTGALLGYIAEEWGGQFLQAAWEGGIRYFETSPYDGHGKSEHRVGHFLRQQPRQAISLVLKSVGSGLREEYRGDAVFIVRSRLYAILVRADRALYSAKHQGRNRVIMAPDGVPKDAPAPTHTT